LTPSIRALLDHLWQEWKYLDHQVEQISGTVEAVAESDEACQRLRQISGVGPLVSTATVAAIGNGAAFSCGSDFAAWLGLVPKQYSTGVRWPQSRLPVFRKMNSRLCRDDTAALQISCASTMLRADKTARLAYCLCLN
jgi:transposase